MRERKRVLSGAIGLTVVGGMLVAGLSVSQLAGLFGKADYEVEFAHAAGLKEGDPVRVSGVKVGSVERISLDGTVVAVRVQLDDDVRLGDRTTAALKVETLLGTEYVSLDSAGDDRLPAGGRVPVERTTTPFSLQEAVGGLAERVEAIDTARLAESFQVVSQALDAAGPELRPAVDGVARLSTSIASRDAQLRELLVHSREVTGVLADRSERLVQLVRDAGTFLAVLESRRQALETLLVSSEQLADELIATVQQTRGDLAPALESLQTTVATLRQNKGDLEESVRLYAPLLRYYTTVLGHGRWFDAALYGLTPQLLPPADAAGGDR